MDTLLSPTDPQPIIHRKGRIPGLLMVAEHAGWAIPQRLNNLGCDVDFSKVHFGCDIGVAEVMRALNDLGAETYESVYSRAVLDPNRDLEADTLIPTMQDGIPLPANAGITSADRAKRIEELYDPYHAKLDALVEDRMKQDHNFLYVSIHSMERQLLVDSFGKKTDGTIRPKIALLCKDKEDALAKKLASFFHSQGIGDIGMNIPYTVKDESIRIPMLVKHQPRMPLIIIEFRNDLLRTPEDINNYARILMSAIQAVHPRAQHPPKPAFSGPHNDDPALKFE